MSVYENFLKMLDFSDAEIMELMPHWRSACRKTGINERDLHFAAEEWLPVYWDLSLHGVRKCIGAYIREFIEVTRLPEYKARGAKLLYYDMPCHPAPLYANRLCGGDRLHISYPDYIIATVFNAFFHKSTSPAAEAAAENRSPVCHQCGMNRLKANDSFKTMIEEPTVLWSWGLYCNEGYKTQELIDALDDRTWNRVLTAIPKDAGSVPVEAEDERRVAYLAAQLREGQRRVSDFTGIEVTDAALSRAVEEYLAYTAKVETLTDLAALADPQPASGNDLILFSVPVQIALDTGLRYVGEALDLMIEELKQRVACGEGPLPKDSPRLACHFVPFSIPWVNKAFMDNGVNLSVNTFFATASRMSRYYDPEHVYRSIAAQWLCNPSAVNMRNEAELVSGILTKYPQDGALYGFFDFDCWIGALQKTMIQMVEERTGIPHFYLESRFWNDDLFSLEDKKARIQNISYKLKINHMMNGWKNAEN